MAFGKSLELRSPKRRWYRHQSGDAFHPVDGQLRKVVRRAERLAKRVNGEVKRYTPRARDFAALEKLHKRCMIEQSSK